MLIHALNIYMKSRYRDIYLSPCSFVNIKSRNCLLLWHIKILQANQNYTLCTFLQEKKKLENVMNTVSTSMMIPSLIVQYTLKLSFTTCNVSKNTLVLRPTNLFIHILRVKKNILEILSYINEWCVPETRHIELDNYNAPRLQAARFFD